MSDRFIATNDSIREAIAVLWPLEGANPTTINNDLIKNISTSQISQWDTSNVTNMKELFKNIKDFNEDISNWNVSNVTDMTGMFYGATTFNQPLDK